jgi:rhodanese-related sulfurtransferase
MHLYENVNREKENAMKDTLKANEIQKGHTIVDVRSPREFEAEKVAGALNIPLGELEQQCQALSQHQNLVLLCASGMRAQKAQELLASRGIKAQVLEGGLKEWSRHNLPVERAPIEGLSMERQVRIVAGALAAIGGLMALLVNPWFAVIPTFVGCGLVFAGVTDTCGMAMLLAKLPYNTRRGSTCCQVPAKQG